MAQIVESIEGLAEACRFFEVPVTGGNVSLYNETLGNPIFPTPVVGIVGKLETAVPVGMAFKRAGSALVLLGGLGTCGADEFGGTQYAKVILDELWGKPPALDMDYEKRVQATIRELIREGAVESAHDFSDGGLAVAIAECAIESRKFGADVNLNSELDPALLLFHEGPSRVLVSTADAQRVLRAATRNNIQAVEIGVTLESRVIIRNRNQVLVDSRVDELSEGWNTALEHLLQTPLQV